MQERNIDDTILVLDWDNFAGNLIAKASREYVKLWHYFCCVYCIWLELCICRGRRSTGCRPETILKLPRKRHIFQLLATFLVFTCRRFRFLCFSGSRAFFVWQFWILGVFSLILVLWSILCVSNRDTPQCAFITTMKKYSSRSIFFPTVETYMIYL